MSIPSYEDLMNNVMRLFTNGFQIGYISVCSRTKSYPDVQLISRGTHNIEDSSVFSNINLNIGVPNYGLDLTSKWNMGNGENTIVKEITWEDLDGDGVKLGGTFQYTLESAAKAWSALGQYRFQNATIDASVEGSDHTNMILNGGIVAGLKGFIAGCQIAFDPAENSVQQSSSATIGYVGPDYSSLLVSVDLLDKNVTGTMYKHVYPNLEFGVISKPFGQNGPFMAIASKYILDPSGFTIRGKFNNKCNGTLGCEVKVLNGLSLFFCTEINLKDFNSGTHKFGAGLEFC